MSTNFPLRIEHRDSMVKSPALPMALAALAELSRHGMADSVPWGYGDPSIIGYDDSMPVGVIIYTKSEWDNQLFVALGHVIPPYQGMGIYRQLWDTLVVKARELKFSSIGGVTHVRNTHMRAVAKALFREERSINLYYPIPPLKASRGDDPIGSGANADSGVG